MLSVKYSNAFVRNIKYFINFEQKIKSIIGKLSKVI